MKILVCGGRDFSDRIKVYEVLDQIHKDTPIDMVITGGARGADRLAEEWAAEYEVPLMVEPADWKTYGKAAGPIRNRLMLVKYGPDLVVAFPGGRGTANMISLSITAGVKVQKI
jgi:hypothetical protein